MLQKFPRIFPTILLRGPKGPNPSGGEWTWISDVESLGALVIDSILGWGQSQGTDPWMVDL